MKLLFIVFLILNINVNGQNKGSKLSAYFMHPDNITFNTFRHDTTITEPYQAGQYHAVLWLNHNIYFKFSNDTLFLKSKIKNGELINDLTSVFCSLDTVKKNKEYKIGNYYGKSSKDGSFILAIPLNTTHPIYFFTDAVSPMMFNYPKFRQSSLFKKIQKSKSWVKYNLCHLA